MTIGDNIKRYRKESKLTQMELATLTNKSKSTIEKYEGNKVTPSLKVLDEIAQALNVTRDDLIDKPQIDDNSPFSKFDTMLDDDGQLFVNKLSLAVYEFKALNDICNMYGYELEEEDYLELKQLIEMFINSKKYEEMEK